jgi:serine/threonine protein kinase
MSDRLSSKTGPNEPLNPKLSVEIHPEAAGILGLDADEVLGVIASSLKEHARLIRDGGEGVRKNAPESAVTLIRLPGRPMVCVKEFRWRGMPHALKGLFRATQGARTFRNGWLLHRAGISAALPLALVRARRSGLIHSEWVVMQVIPEATELDRYLVKRISAGWTPEERRGLTRLLGRFIGSMHARGIFHSDLKTCNILVSDEIPYEGLVAESGLWRLQNPCRPVKFSLVDYDDVLFAGQIPHEKRVKNLVQIFLSTPTTVSAPDRMRFLSEYALHAGINSQGRHQMAKDVIKMAKGRKILYVGFEGDVVESWER